MRNWLNRLPEGSPLMQYLRCAENMADEALFEERYERIVRVNAGEERFLTVVMRTQGRRIDIMRDTLLSLAAQTDDDFEVVIVGHKITPACARAVEDLIAEQPDELSERIRFATLMDGQRGAPLNLGFAMARSRYIVALDDDDLVMDNWVETYHKAEEEHGGMILHAYALGQAWQADAEKGGRQPVAAAGGMETTFCAPYDTMMQLRGNVCPIQALAYPAYLVREMHILFSETLTTIEDWDFLQRCAYVCGVHDIPEVTSIYRLWKNVESSRSIEAAEIWKKNREQVEVSFRTLPLLVPAEQAAPLRDEFSSRDLWHSGPFISCSTLYIDQGASYSTDRCVKAAPVMENDWYAVTFRLQQGMDENIREIRFDIAEIGMFGLTKMMVELRYRDGGVVRQTMGQMKHHNGVLLDVDALYFLTSDPIMTFEADPNRPLDSVYIECKLIFECPPELRYSAMGSFGGGVGNSSEESDRVQAILRKVEADYQTVINSRCWRMTAPLRKIMDRLKGK